VASLSVSLTVAVLLGGVGVAHSRGAKIGPVFKLETVTVTRIQDSSTNYVRTEYISECAQIRTFMYQEMCLSDIAIALVMQLLTLSWRRDCRESLKDTN